jgi:hypothetical protein
MVFQTPYNMSHLLQRDVSDHAQEVGSDKVITGRFRPNVSTLSTVVKDQDGDIRQLLLNPNFVNLFAGQTKLPNPGGFQEELMNMKVTHPNVFMLLRQEVFLYQSWQGSENVYVENLS